MKGDTEVLHNDHRWPCGSMMPPHDINTQVKARACLLFDRVLFGEGNCFCGERKCEKHPTNLGGNIREDISPPEGPEKITAV